MYTSLLLLVEFEGDPLRDLGYNIIGPLVEEQRVPHVLDQHVGFIFRGRFLVEVYDDKRIYELIVTTHHEQVGELEILGHLSDRLSILVNVGDSSGPDISLVHQGVFLQLLD